MTHADLITCAERWLRNTREVGDLPAIKDLEEVPF